MAYTVREGTLGGINNKDRVTKRTANAEAPLNIRI